MLTIKNVLVLTMMACQFFFFFFFNFSGKKSALKNATRAVEYIGVRSACDKKNDSREQNMRAGNNLVGVQERRGFEVGSVVTNAND